jgi:2-polyprenyl-6-methoxyphenol hydroxylase-like FAD-dependent oxidoreductase
MTALDKGSRKALIVGAGIAGMSAASALRNAGWDAVIVERSPARRRGGYFIAMFGSGRIAANRMGLRGIRDRAPEKSPTFQVDRANNRKGGFGLQGVANGPWMMLRGDVEQSAYDAISADVAIRFSTTPTAITQDGEGATVTLHDTGTDKVTEERFDLVVGADGLRSTVRRLLWGPHENYLHRLGFMICAFELPHAIPGLEQEHGAILCEDGRSFWVFPFADHAPTVLFSYKTDDVDAEFARTKQVGVAERLREVYGPEALGDMMDASVKHLEQADEYLFDSVEQARVDQWHKGRVVLLGDAAWCPTLYSGMGATSSLAGADALGIALAKHPDDLETAFRTWEGVMRPAIANFQEAGFTMRALFTQISRKERRDRSLFLKVRPILVKIPILVALLMKSKRFRLRNDDLAAQLL